MPPTTPPKPRLLTDKMIATASAIHKMTSFRNASCCFFLLLLFLRPGLFRFVDLFPVPDAISYLPPIIFVIIFYAI